MTRVSQLFDLQDIDSGMERRVVRLRQIDEQMLDSPTLVAARQVHEEARGVLAAHQAELKKLSEETEDVSRRIKTQDARLYNGTVKNPKELGQIHEEVTHLKTRLRSLEESELDAMMQVEESENLAAARASELEAVEKEWEQYTTGLLEEKEKLIEQIHVLQVKRQKTSAEIPFGDLQTYERLRRTKAGLAVSPVIDGACSVCRVGVPVHIVRAARPGTDIVTCPSCGRILYATSDVKFKEFDHNLDNINR